MTGPLVCPTEPRYVSRWSKSMQRHKQPLGAVSETSSGKGALVLGLFTRPCQPCVPVSPVHSQAGTRLDKNRPVSWQSHAIWFL